MMLPQPIFTNQKIEIAIIPFMPFMLSLERESRLKTLLMDFIANLIPFDLVSFSSLKIKFIQIQI